MIKLSLRAYNSSNADIVFITDGICSIGDDFVADLKGKLAAFRFTVTGILMDQEESMEFSLTPFCNIVHRISELGGDRIVDALLNERTV